MPPSFRRLLDFDLETVAAGFADPEWVPQTITAWAYTWVANSSNVPVSGADDGFSDQETVDNGRRLISLGKPEKVDVATLAVADFYNLDARREFLTPLVAAVRSAGIVTGHNIRCMTPETRVLTGDLQWVPAGDLSPGDSLLAFDEHVAPGGRRRMQHATVIANTARIDDVYAVELGTGQVLYATGEHPWLVSTQSGPGVKHRWRRTDELLGAKRVGHGGTPKGPVKVYKVLDPWERDYSYEAGWLAGAYDGEGCLTRHGRDGRVQSQLVFNQNAGTVFDRATQLLTSKGFAFSVSDQRKCLRLRLDGGKPEKFRFLGQIRPERLLAKWRELDPGRLTQLEAVDVVSVTPVGPREIAALATSSATYIAEGYAVHNSFDLPVLNADLMRVGLDPLDPVLVQDTIRLPKSKGFKKGQDVLSDVLGVKARKQAMNWAEWAAGYASADHALIRDRVAGDVRQHVELRQRMLEAGWLQPPRMWKP